MSGRKIEFYRDAIGEVRWRYRAANGSDILADSGQGYSRVIDAVTAATTVCGPQQQRLFTGLDTERFVGNQQVLALADLDGNYGETPQAGE